MAKRRDMEFSSDEEDHIQTLNSSPERPLQTTRRTGEKTKASKQFSDDENEEKVAKPAKKSKAPAKPKAAKKPRFDSPEPSKPDTSSAKVGVNERGEKYVELGKKKRATINTFKGGKFLDIREFYGDEGDLKPGKKGISLNLEQWQTLKDNANLIDSLFAKLK